MNRIKMGIVLILCFTFVSWEVRENPQETISTASLFYEMIDMERLSRYPDPAYKTVQFSSFDRRSQIPGGVDWYAN